MRLETWLWIALALMLVYAWDAVHGHEANMGWTYPRECCGGHDCMEVQASRVTTNQLGYLVDGEMGKAYRDTRVSPDGKFHMCVTPGGKLLCFFAPPAVM